MTAYRNYVGGEWIGGEGVSTNINPSDTSDVIGEYVQASRDDAHTAVAAARAALPNWRLSPIQQRFDILDRIGAEILARKEELGRLLSREEGKTLPEGVAEVARAGMIFKFFAGEALRNSGERLASVRPGVSVEVLREPVGVVGIVSPWNFPVAIPAWKIAPALAFGNCVVFKPASLAPGSAWALAEIISRAGMPEGVFNLLMGSGGAIGDVLTGADGVDAVTFTGSDVVGRGIAARAVTTGKKVQLEMGGKNPLVVLEDADLETAVNCAIQGAFYSTGQRCTASSRLIVTGGIHDRFVEALCRRMRELTVDHALAPGADIGPVVSQEQLDQDLAYLDLGKEEGAHLAFGGERVERKTRGFYLTPALFTGTHNAMRINRDEIFGPIAAVIRVQGYDEALETANDTHFGLVAGIVTRSLKYADDFKKKAAAGMVMVNLPTAGVDYHVPFGGSKGSSYGAREQGSYAREFYTTVKTAYTLP